MPVSEQDRRLIIFLLGSATFLFIGTTHGVVQSLPGIRDWLVSVGTPVSGPGHMIDPLAHAHINLVGGVVLIGMAMTYYLFPRITGMAMWSAKMITHSFWWIACGVVGFYCTLMVFGITEGRMMRAGLLEQQAAFHSYYGPSISISAIIMTVGFMMFFINVFITARRAFANHQSA